MFVYIQPLVWFGISRTHVQYPSDLLTVNTVTSESECDTFFYYFRLIVKVIIMSGWLAPLLMVHNITGNEVVMW